MSLRINEKRAKAWKEETEFLESLKAKGLIDSFSGRVDTELGNVFWYNVWASKGKEAEAWEALDSSPYRCYYEKKIEDGDFVMYGKPFFPLQWHQ